MARKKEEEIETTTDNTTAKTEVKSKPNRTGRVKKQEPQKMVVKKTLLECIDELEDSYLIFEKLVRHNLYQQYKEERELKKQDRFITPTIDVNEFKKLMED